MKVKRNDEFHKKETRLDANPRGKRDVSGAEMPPPALHSVST
jgi:hypothetical protein